LALSISFSLSDLLSSDRAIGIGTVDGMYLEASQSGETVVFSHNLSLDKPGKAEAVGMMESIQKAFCQYCESDPEFRSYMANKEFIAELHVFSGHMDFPVARLCGADIEWFTELD
jgi:hypothetical protein